MQATGRNQQILLTAARLFRLYGYHGTSMQDLAEALGLQRGSLYHYIESKEEILYTLMKEAIETFIRQVEPIVLSSQPAAQRLRNAVAAHLRVLVSLTDAVAVFLHELKALGSSNQQHIVALRDHYEGLYRKLLAEGIADGSFRPIEPKVATFAILGILNWPYHWYKPEGPLTVEQLAESFSDLILRGLQATTEGR
jgi:AcrR family transcriptional regulator